MLNYLLNFDFKKDILPIGIEVFEKIIGKVIIIFCIIILMYICIKVGKYLIKKFVDKQIKSNARLSLDSKRAITLGEVMKSILKYSVYFLGIAGILSNLVSGISFTFASIGGFAVGFGTQSLVKDLINGFFILFENQFGVGDHITVGTFNGIVESIGIRTTIIKDFTGDIHSIPNGSIVQVTNHSRGNIRFLVNVEISYEENIDNAINVIKGVCEQFEQGNEDVKEPIQVLGVDAIKPSSVTIKIIGKTKPLKQWDMERELRRLIKLKLDEEGIKIPYANTKLININTDKEND